MSGRSTLKVLVDEVEDQGKNPTEPVASAVDYMSTMQKRLAAYQADAPDIDIDAPGPPRLSGVPTGAMALVVSETMDEAVDTNAHKNCGPKTAAEKRKEARRAARAAKKLDVSRQGE
ncbi:hypothetical protein SARC_08929 [Sphaeroforma arctica JP610]|uniref:Uncharacterized protein n=1 Tax=Sphaeroforma arctica JP610 TaxID=667725 RepID=A0A0L0FQ50_9EUKA|nr:hypothetical protein SARC_08929 [Sphaeroforma arctica JP610]KNC78646.1 hypothetical protein SARC_08929 [Sphaeroforma arctica JP610]|eukprot:XP_014152548.1 hypothetical protein SARC_08929 [Sphaeroforma arctica JP610]